MRILIISSCTGTKKFKPKNQLRLEDFKLIGTDKFVRREKELSSYLTLAQDLYTGQQHVRLMKGIEYLRDSQFESKNGIEVDFKILSAGYGLIKSDRWIVPYECTFQSMKKSEIDSLSNILNISKDFRKVISNYYDLCLLLLGDSYLRACQIDEDIEWGGPTILFCGKQVARRMPDHKLLKVVPVSNVEAKNFSCGLVGLKGELAANILKIIKDDPNILNKIVDNKVDLLRILEKTTSNKSTKKNKKVPPNKQPIIHVPDRWLEKSRKNKLRYYIPEWDDLVNPEYDFMNDIHPPGTGDAYQYAVYAHQIFDEPPYDGILVSKIIVESKRAKKKILSQLGVHRYLRVPRSFPIMGDCGAFGYIMEDDPPYETEEILNYYQSLDFDYGVSIDHLIVPGALKKEIFYLVKGKEKPKEINVEEYNQLKSSGQAEEINSLKGPLSLLLDNKPKIFKKEFIDEDKRQYRYDLTINNAKEFIEKHKKGNYSFTPVGAVQGWSPESYSYAVKEYQKMGYNYIALGGLVRTPTKGILEILEAINKILKPDVNLHLFGVARLNALEDMYRLGVRSIDSASFLRRAWLGATSNYFTPNGNYAAIRVPQADKSPRAKRIVKEGKATFEELQQLEKKCLDLLRAYDRGEIEIDPVLDTIMTYDNWIGDNRNGYRELFRKTLEDRPWQKCGCRICKEQGIDVIIFRGNNRNRRRGFHNTKVFYDQLCHMFGEN